MQEKKINQFLKARDAYSNGIIKSKRKAIMASGLSATTYYKYEKEFGEKSPVKAVKQPTKLETAASIIDTHYQVEDQTTRQLVQENTKLRKLLIEKLLKENGL